MVSDEMLSLLTKATNQPLLANMGEPGGEARYGQGRILSWNPDTFENSVSYRGAVINNMSVLSGPDALTYRQDDVVAVMSFSPNRGATVYWIMGRVIVPGPGKAAETIEWMTSELGSAIAASVFADRIKFDQVFISEDGATTTFGDLATVGPIIEDIEITEAGKLVVLMACAFAPPVPTISTSHMSFQLDGPSPRAAQVATSVQVGFNIDNPGDMFISMTRQETLEGLLPGTYTLTAKYAAFGAGGPDAFFTNREIMTIAF